MYMNVICTTSVQKPCEDNKDFAILRFHGGPPYEVHRKVVTFCMHVSLKFFLGYCLQDSE